MAIVLHILAKIGNFIKALLSSLWKRFTRQINRQPVGTFAGFLALIILLIVVGNFLRRPPEQKEAAVQTPKTVEVFSIGALPKVQVPAQVQKSGVITVVNQLPSLVDTIYKSEGQEVVRGNWLFHLANTATGATTASLSREIAAQNYQFVSDNFDSQIELIQKRKDIAEKSDGQADSLRDISSKSLDDTRNLISLNEQMVTSIDAQLTELQSDTTTDNSALILQTQQAKAGVLAGLNGLKTALRNSEYQVDENKEPAELSNLSKDVTLKQLEIEEKSLKLNREISKLNLQLASVAESMMYPAAPCTGTVERVFVKFGQMVNPGTPLALITCTETSATIVAQVPRQLAQTISRLEKAAANIDGQLYSFDLTYMSSEPTNGQTFSAIYAVPKESLAAFANLESISLTIPLGTKRTSAAVPYIPLDALYQTQADAYVFVAEKQTDDTYIAKSRTVTPKSVYGDFVEITNGLNTTDQIIVDRTVIDGDPILLKP